MTTNEYTFHINSKNRLNGTDSNFEYAINLNDKDITHCSLQFADVPHSYYSVRNNYNTFTLTENGVSTTITISQGSYKQKYWLSTLSSALTSASTLGLTYTATMATSPNDGKITFSVSSTAGKTLALTFASNLYEPCGFDESSTNSFSYSSGVYTLRSVNCIKLYSESTLYLRADCVMTNDNILAPIYAAGSLDFSNIVFTNPIPIESAKKITNGNVNKVKFSLVNERHEIIELNGINMNFTLIFFKKIDTYKKVEDFMDLFKKYIEYKILSKDTAENKDTTLNN